MRFDGLFHNFPIKPEKEKVRVKIRTVNAFGPRQIEQAKKIKEKYQMEAYDEKPNK